MNVRRIILGPLVQLMPRLPLTSYRDSVLIQLAQLFDNTRRNPKFTCKVWSSRATPAMISFANSKGIESLKCVRSAILKWTLHSPMTRNIFNSCFFVVARNQFICELFEFILIIIRDNLIYIEFSFLLNILIKRHLSMNFALIYGNLDKPSGKVLFG